MRFARESPFPPADLTEADGLRGWLRRPTIKAINRDAGGGDARRRARVRARRGRRRGRARTPRRPGSPRSSASRARDQHADQRGRDHGRRDRRRPVGAAARCSRSCSSTSSRSRSTSSSNAAAKAHFMSGGQLTVPLVVRTQGGAGHRGAAQHSQSLESWLTHVPGLKVVMPSRAVDAAGLLAERDRRPEPGRLHREQDALLPQGGGARRAPGRADRGGGGAAGGARRHDRRALAARPRRARRGGASRSRGRHRGGGDRPAHARSRSTWRRSSHPCSGRRGSSSRTRRSRTAAFGAEIAAHVQEAAFDYLDAPDRAGRRAVRAGPVQRAARGRLPARRGRDRRRRAGGLTMIHHGRNIWLPKEAAPMHDYVIVGAGIGGLRARRAPQRGPRRRRCAAGGRRPGQPRRRSTMPAMFPVLSSSRASTGTSWASPSPGSAAGGSTLPRGKRDRRLRLDQRHDLPARPPRRLRRLGGGRLPRAGSYDEVLPYFKRSEDNERGEDAFHGVGGPLSVSDSRSLTSFTDLMLEAAVQAGYEHIPDLNVDRPEGVCRFQLTQRNGLRCSTADAFLHPAEGRPNLEVVTGACSSSGSSSRATAPSASRSCATASARPIRAEREVIVSGGRVPVAGAADAVRDRPRRGARAVRDRRAAGASGRQEPPGPLHGQRQLPHRRARRSSGSSRRRTSRSSRARAVGR